MDASPSPSLIPRRLGPRQVAFGLVTLALAGVSGTAITLYLQREAIGVRLGLDYLRAHGVPAELKLDRLDLGGVSGSLRLGPSARPDLTVGRMEAEFGALPAPWRGVRPPPIKALRLVQPVLHARWRDGRIDFGTLQPLVDQSLAAKPSGEPAPDLSIREGRLVLDTPSGPVDVVLDADIVRGEVRSLHARLAPTDLAALGLRVGRVEGVLSGQATGAGALHLTAAFSAADGSAAGGGAASVHAAREAAAGLTLSLEALTPNGPAGLLQLGDRPLDAVARLQATRFSLQPQHGAPIELRGADLSLEVDGGVSRQGAFTGKLHATGRAAHLARAGVDLDATSLELKSDAARASSGQAGTTAQGPFTLALSTHGGRVRTAGLQATLAPASLSAAGRLSLDHGLALQAQGAAQAAGGLAAGDASRLAQRSLGRIDAAAATALSRALQRVSLRAPAYALSYDTRRGAMLHLPQGLQALVSGGALTMRPEGGAPVVEASPRGAVSGAFSAALRVQGLPQLDLDAAHLARSGAGAVQLATALTARGALGPVKGASLQIAGQVNGAEGRWNLATRDCATLGIVALALHGRAAATDVRAQVCPDDARPLLTAGPHGWRVAAVARDVGLVAPAAQVKAQLVSAVVSIDGSSGGDPTGRVELRGLAVQDTAAVARVRPLAADGTVGLAAGRAQGRLTLALAPHATPLGVLAFSARTADGSGEAVLDTGRLSFAAKGLQPGDIVPAAAHALPEAQGDVDLTARAAWTRAGVASSGEVRTSGFSFKSPAGKIDGLRGDIHLASLSPLLSAPGQTLDADRLETLVPLDDLHAAFTLAADHLDLQGASATVAGGRASLDAMRLPLIPGAPISGVLRIRDVDLDKLIAVLNLANAVDLQARLGGELPFALQPEAAGATALRFTDGRLYAEGPGRLTIRRQALTGAVATAGAEGAQPNAVQDFAYQALENLAFSQLDAKVASRPGGRLGVVFHVVGRHDPPVDRPTRIGLFALLRGHAFDKPLPLPKGTPVELTLDTSLNLDDILAAYGRMNGAPAPGSAKVQP